MSLDQLLLERTEQVVGQCIRILGKPEVTIESVMLDALGAHYGILQFAARFEVVSSPFDEVPPVVEAEKLLSSKDWPDDPTEAYLGNLAASLIAKYFLFFCDRVGQDLDTSDQPPSENTIEGSGPPADETGVV